MCFIYLSCDVDVKTYENLIYCRIKLAFPVFLSLRQSILIIQNSNHEFVKARLIN